MYSQDGPLMEMLAHDLRILLTSCNLTLDLLAQEDNDNKFVRLRRVSHLKQLYAKSITLLEDLLSLQKSKAGELTLSLQLVDLKETVEDALQIMAPQARQKNVTLKAAIGNSELVADRIRILQVLTNLISNAIKHAPANTPVTVAAVNRRSEVEITITDQGDGIPAEKSTVLFGRFSQVSPADAETGFGLGLSISKAIVNKHGGSIGVRHERNRGTTFFFTLPVDNDDCAAIS